MLTTKEIEGLVPRKNAYYQSDNTRTRGSSGKGKGRLIVKTFPSGSKTFMFRYFVNGKATFIKIGYFPEVSLADARDRITRYCDWLAKGEDPKQQLEYERLKNEQEQRAQNALGTIQQLLEAHAKSKEKNGRRNFQVDLEAVEKELYTYVEPNKKAKDIVAGDLIPCFADMIHRGAAVKANKIRSILHSAFNFGLKFDNDPANYTPGTAAKFALSFNPISAIPKQTDAERVGEHFLSMQETKSLLHDMQFRFDDLRIRDTTRDIIILCFHIGGQRPYEVVNTLWTDINWENKTLTIRKEIFKTNKPHVIPLTETAINLLKKRLDHSKSPYVFHKKTNLNEPTPTNTIAQAIAYYRQVTPNIHPFTPRDFRRTFKTLGGELGLSKEIRDRIQGHALNDVSTKHYDRYDYLQEKRDALKVWEAALLY
ncbi:tyrosine-type recombinase/integrase [Vibrio breoganii]